jgi:hypothetical protein
LAVQAEESEPVTNVVTTEIPLSKRINLTRENLIIHGHKATPAAGQQLVKKTTETRSIKPCPILLFSWKLVNTALRIMNED